MSTQKTIVDIGKINDTMVVRFANGKTLFATSTMDAVNKIIQLSKYWNYSPKQAVSEFTTILKEVVNSNIWRFRKLGEGNYSFV